MIRMTVSKLVLLRHGESKGNKEGFFTGKMNVDLTEEGEQQAYRAGELLRDIPFHVGYTSTLLRAERTLEIVLKAANQSPEIIKSPKLEERNYGILTGMNKEMAERRFGKDKISSWRRSYREGPPRGESLQDIERRAVPYFEDPIAHSLKMGNALVVSHAGTMIALTKYLEGIPESQLDEVGVPNCTPVVYEIDTYRSKILNKEVRNI